MNFWSQSGIKGRILLANPLRAYFNAQKSPCCGIRSKSLEWHDHAQSWVRQQYPVVNLHSTKLSTPFPNSFLGPSNSIGLCCTAPRPITLAVRDQADFFPLVANGGRREEFRWSNRRWKPAVNLAARCDRTGAERRPLGESQANNRNLVDR